MKFFAVALTVFSLTGCSMNSAAWDTMAPTVTAATEFAARTALQHQRVIPHAAAICTAMESVSDALENLHDVDATFGGVIDAGRRAVWTSMPEGPIRDITIAVVDQILSMALIYAQDKYADFLEEDETKVTVIVAGAVAKGVVNACADLNLSSFSFKPLPDISR